MFTDYEIDASSFLIYRIEGFPGPGRVDTELQIDRSNIL